MNKMHTTYYYCHTCWTRDNKGQILIRYYEHTHSQGYYWDGINIHQIVWKRRRKR